MGLNHSKSAAPSDISTGQDFMVDDSNLDESELHMPPPEVLVLYNEPVLPADHPEAPSEYDVLDTVTDTVKILRAAGFSVRQLGINLDPLPLISELRTNRPAAVFNLFEGIATQTATEISVAALLEWLNIPFTGCPSLALSLGRDKIRTKHLLRAAGLPTPDYRVIEHDEDFRWQGGWPAIVKPALQDASVGIDQGSVVTNHEELTSRVRYIFKKYGGPILVEQFLGGREFHVNVIEECPEAGERSMRMLPIAEIAFQEISPHSWPVYTFAAKWNVESDEYKASPLITPVVLPAEQVAVLYDVATRAFRLLQCRDFARMDVRMSSEGVFHILEVNPNPYLNSLALVKGLEAIGRTHEQFLVEMTLNTIARGGGHVPRGTITVPVGVITS
jgi:D-alanine-D-alanine ligase